MLKITYTTIVNKDFEPYVEQLIKSHQMFSRIDLTIYTINFKITDRVYPNVKFVEFQDDNLKEFEETGENRLIKSDYEKHKYTTLLKTKVLRRISDLYDYYFFVDSDGILTKNSDSLVLNTINEFGISKFPISVKYFHQYSSTHKYKEPVFKENMEFNPKSLGYYPLIELFGTEFNQIDYLTTYCVYYTKGCIEFLEEAEKICFSAEVIKDYDRYLPLGDETVFNYLYSKYNFREYISGYLCFDINSHMGIDSVLSNIKRMNSFISFIHTKRFIENKNEEGPNIFLKSDEYDKIFQALNEKEYTESGIKITSLRKEGNLDIINFNVIGDYNSNYNLKIVSLFRPKEEYSFNMNLAENINFFVCKNSDVKVKDLHLLVTYFDGYFNKLKDCVKIQ